MAQEKKKKKIESGRPKPLATKAGVTTKRRKTH